MRRPDVQRVTGGRKRRRKATLSNVWVPFFCFSPPIFHVMAPYQSLKAWQHAQRLAIECVKAARGFPDYEQGALADQLRRACYSVVLNIAEGSAKRGSREYRKYLDAAHGSLAEVETALGIARELAYLRPAEFGRLEALASETGKTLFGLLRKITASATHSTSLLAPQAR